MQRWLILSAGIVIVMIIALVFVARAFITTPIPAPPAIADAPLAIHINEIDLATSGVILVSIDNLTTENITIDVSELGQAISQSLRLFDPTGNEWTWVDSKGRVGNPLSVDTSWQWAGGWGQEARVPIEAGRTENFTLVVNPAYSLAAREWAARMRKTPAWLVYVIDCEIPTAGSGGGASMRVTAKGEAGYLPRP